MACIGSMISKRAMAVAAAAGSAAALRDRACVFRCVRVWSHVNILVKVGQMGCRKRRAARAHPPLQPKEQRPPDTSSMSFWQYAAENLRPGGGGGSSCVETRSCELASRSSGRHK